ncbi:hypothetical protein [Streptomyces sindenensis]|uniref:hypothetical protein n=1 Tax=Streptomyces sindenensis TaxID=67363 RepID=UPI0019A635FA|nr:hypothetical protein [Streptomyces sindenensis]GGP81885.1 hypothetical protein GCM10010231_61030 [Streptomyces sindenensis]
MPLVVGFSLSAAGIGGASACSSQKAADDGAAELAHRARQVAAAWDGSAASAVRRAGYFPTGEQTQLPKGGLRTKADEQAYESQNFVLRGSLPTGPKDGRVTWSGKAALTRPLVEADASYRALASTSAKDEPHLSVTGAKLGEMKLVTSRGPATVPAWLFTLDGYDTPLKRAAAVPSTPPRPPIGPTSNISGHPIHQFVRTSADGLSVTVIVLQGNCEDAPAVKSLETSDSVVLSSPVQSTNRGGNCTKRGKLRQVTVELERPVTDRVLLDALTGEPVPYLGRRGLSPKTT